MKHRIRPQVLPLALVRSSGEIIVDVMVGLRKLAASLKQLMVANNNCIKRYMLNRISIYFNYEVIR